MNQLEQLKQFTTVVGDTGDFETGKAYNVQDATTNPSLILAASKQPKYAALIDDAVTFALDQKKDGSLQELVNLAMNKCLVNFGTEWLKIIPGRVSTEVDARLSFDAEGTVAKGKEIIALYESMGINRERVLLKIAGTWEGIEAARVLEAEGIHTNVTLLFNNIQAIAAAQNANATFVSAFVGRILDWHKAKTGKAEFPGDTDPGVQSVKQIFQYFKKFGIKTVLMGASFRNTSEIIELAGVDNLTISPDLMQRLSESTEPIERKLNPEGPFPDDLVKIDVDEKTFRWLLNEDACATEKLADGIRRFAADIVTLEGILCEKISAKK